MSDAEWHSGLFICLGDKFTFLIDSQQVSEAVLFWTPGANVHMFAC